MAFPRKTFAIVSSVFLLTGCMEGFEFVKTDTHFPYGNQRTAGSGVAYVLAKMMPEKEMNLEPIKEEVEEVAREREPEIIEPPVAEPVPEELPQLEPLPEAPPPPAAMDTKADKIFLDDAKK